MLLPLNNATSQFHSKCLTSFIQSSARVSLQFRALHMRLLGTKFPLLCQYPILNRNHIQKDSFNAPHSRIGLGSVRWRTWRTEELSENQLTAQNPHYVSLREHAVEEHMRFRDCIAEKRSLYLSGDADIAELKNLSARANAHKKESARLNREAGDWIFEENNKFTRHGRIDLHSLYANEAVYHARKALLQAKEDGRKQVVFIVGRALFRDRKSKIKETLNKLVKELNFISVVDPTNPGLLVVFTSPDEHYTIDRSPVGQTSWPRGRLRGLEEEGDDTR